MTSPPYIVVDASVAVKWILPESGRTASLALLRGFVEGQSVLLAPRTLTEEVASAMCKRFRRKQLTAEQVRVAFDYFQQRRPVLVDDPGLLGEALDLSLRHRLSLWDCLYLALAMRHRCNLVTADQRLVRSASRHYPFVELIA